MSGSDSTGAEREKTSVPEEDRPDDALLPIEAGDGWLVGALSAEGWRAATSPDQTEPPVGVSGEDVTTTARGVAPGVSIPAEPDDARPEETPSPPGNVTKAGSATPGVGRGASRDDGTVASAPDTGAAQRGTGATHGPLAKADRARPSRPAAVPGPATEEDRAGGGASGAVPVRGVPAPGEPGRRSVPRLTEDTIVRARPERPRGGWRGLLYTASGSVLNPGIGAVERVRQEQIRRIRSPLPAAHHIAVGSIKGGVGKTTVSACLGLVLAERRGDRVIAFDASPDAGTLADRLTGGAVMTVRNLLGEIGSLRSLADVARFTSLAGRLQVLASEQDPAMSDALDRVEYERVCAVLARFYDIVITDSGPGLVHSAMEGTLALADSLVVVGAPTVDGASRTNKTLDWLVVHGHADRVADSVVVLSCDRSSRQIDTGRVRSHFEGRCRAVVEVPYDPHLATGARIEPDRLRPATAEAFLELAALLADGFAATTAGPGPIPARG